MTLTPGQTKTLYAFWVAQLPRGEYQGQILVEGTSTAILTPYWYGAPTLIPRGILELNPPNTAARVGSTITLYVRVTDDIGFPLTTDATLGFAGTASAGATIDLLPGVIFPNLRAIRLRLATTARDNTFQFRFGGLAPVTHVITGRTTP